MKMKNLADKFYFFCDKKRQEQKKKDSIIKIYDNGYRLFCTLGYFFFFLARR